MFRFLNEGGLYHGLGSRLRLGSGALASPVYRQPIYALLSEAVIASEFGALSIAEARAQLFGSQQGIWFYTGWIDQAILHVELVRPGGGECLEPMLRSMEQHPIDQGGDMLVGYWLEAESALFEIANSQDDAVFTVDVRAPSERQLEVTLSGLGLPPDDLG